MINYNLIPEHMRAGLQLYLESGEQPGDFLYAVLTNNLVATFGCADHINLERIQDWVSFMYNEMPMSCWGSVEKVEHWMQVGGFRGTQGVSNGVD